MTNKLTFNEIILRLLEYWKDQGCLIWQPYNVQVGAGTMNPATVLRVLGPEPWNVVYVEPSIRPDDGRFGDNPNRLQQHHQLQVILQPDPGNPQELYLKSLEAIGIDPRQHDIRFVEDNWESPAQGAWGLGWEVWLDGQEITQFTYFQQAGGHELDPVAVEITYGLDRIAITLQDVQGVWDLDFGSGVSYKDVLLASEIEHCEYYFNGADVEALVETYNTYEREAQRCITAGLVAPAHDYNLKCSHIFNVLDTRGAIGVTERAGYFKRMRNTQKEISSLYLAQREKLGYPFLQNERWLKDTSDPVLHQLTHPQTNPQTFLLEIGSEELPAQDLTSAINQVRQALPELLDNLRLSYDRIEVHGTPRRVAAIVHNLAPQQTDLESEAKGPPADRAFDAEGNPTKAAIGFARGKGVDVSELRVKEDGNRSYVVVSVFEAGRATAEVLGEEMPAFIASLKYERTMRWNHTNISYSRPLRWFVGLFGEQVVPFAYAGIASGKVSRGIRPYDSPDILVENAESYAQTMRDNQIIINNDERQNTILESVTKLATGLGGTIIADANLLDEVTNLVEAPTAFVGSFEEKYLKLPAEALVAVMKKHQRYFPVYAHDDKTLLPYFIAVRNGDNQHLESVQHGNEHVIRARFADADFFYNKDSQKTLEEHRHGLAKLTFQYKLGSMLDKVHRLEKLVPQLANSLGLDREQQKIASRAASLSKADLATNFVVEMTSLQGILGGHYAKKNGESDAVANAIAEQYDAVSSTPASLALALADRLDSLVGLFSAGLAPKGSNDPFALRRAAIHIIENLIGNAVDMDVRPAIRIASDLLPIESTPKHRQAVADFIAGRLEVVLKEKGIKTSVVNAVLAEQSHNPYLASQTVVALQNATEASDWETLLDAYARCVRITRNLDQQYPIRPADFALPAEQALYQAYANAKESADGTLDTFVASLRLLEPAITNFFDDVLVMDEELAVRENRLGLLGEIASLTNGIADLSQLEGF